MLNRAIEDVSDYNELMKKLISADGRLEKEYAAQAPGNRAQRRAMERAERKAETRRTAKHG